MTTSAIRRPRRLDDGRHAESMRQPEAIETEIRRLLVQTGVVRTVLHPLRVLRSQGRRTKRREDLCWRDERSPIRRFEPLHLRREQCREGGHGRRDERCKGELGQGR